MISKTHISAQKPRRRQLNAKVCGKESAIFLILSFFLRYDHLFKQQQLENGSSCTPCHFITKLTLITSRSSTTTQCLHNYNFTLVNKALCPVAVRCVGRHFLMLCACAHVVSFPNQRPQSLVWEQD